MQPAGVLLAGGLVAALLYGQAHPHTMLSLRQGFSTSELTFI
jgi:hypothetical protein